MDDSQFQRQLDRGATDVENHDKHFMRIIGGLLWLIVAVIVSIPLVGADLFTPVEALLLGVPLAPVAFAAALAGVYALGVIAEWLYGVAGKAKDGGDDNA
jgi:hypothetical protein